MKENDLLQARLDKPFHWSGKWLLNSNLSKCFVLHIGNNNLVHTYNINQRALENAFEAVDLGS